MSSCLRKSYGFTGLDGPVLMCKVKLGDCETFSALDPSHVPKGQHSSRFNDEYVIYDGKRILPIEILQCGEV
jgi:hypothetical protein